MVSVKNAEEKEEKEFIKNHTKQKTESGIFAFDSVFLYNSYLQNAFCYEEVDYQGDGVYKGCDEG